MQACTAPPRNNHITSRPPYYFAGYYAAKAYAAIATEGENSAKPQLWTQWLDGMHRGLVAPYYEQWLKDGGWPEGWHDGGSHLVNVFDSDKMYRVEVRPGSSGAQKQWLTVLDASASPAAVAGASVVNASSGASPNVQGANLSRAGEQTVVLFSTGAWDHAISGPVSYGVPVASTMHVIADLQSGVEYAVGVATVGNEHRVNVQPGAGIMSSPNGTLEFLVTSGGQVQTN